ncbi:hypothetical protein, partial [Escherichia coli]
HPVRVRLDARQRPPVPVQKLNNNPLRRVFLWLGTSLEPRWNLTGTFLNPRHCWLEPLEPDFLTFSLQ